ncbi:glutamate-cysteine ligase family protein [Candidatus Cyanaurora vandensis]|nr:glutamate-cysteine ligase family protein [Candidatus Cyanaurora vandensis]
MGQEIATSHFTPQDLACFEAALRCEMELLTQWFQKGSLAPGPKTAGCELECWLVDPSFRPLPSNEEFLARVADPLVGPELARFNVELNTSPLALTGSVLRRMAQELTQTWQHCTQTAQAMDADLMMIGILPTVRQEELSVANMSAMTRYRALNEQVFRLRQERPLRIDIRGREQLACLHHDIMIEAAATSFQVHLQVGPEEAVRYYNAAQILSAPMVALSANSPYLFGKDLWDETRIPLFEQAVAGGDPEPGLNRVTFGSGYITHSLLACFQENSDRYPILLPIPQADRTEAMAHVRLHNGTIWRWNRPLVGFNTDGTPHLRIEHRVIPAGPTIADMVANAAFFYGLVHTLATQPIPPEQLLSFGAARDNFYRACQTGLATRLTWFGDIQVPVQGLITETLLPLAHRGLAQLAIDPEDRAYYLGIIEERVQKLCNGATW